ncbi:MAG: FKBP-type peptidyl-prolyl cis-trans isomerase [Tannerellaceae bacterium]|jgi:peptidylprolyl isomerase/FKBP-type peptidyl-prolyl cis-trans isomerase FklB|nr:FKBP-type peptidyl-prolyl cis-trans isomerase [Tannerellaceae bacterium]
MKALKYTCLFLFFAGLACTSDVPEEIDEDWKNRNQETFLAISEDEAYREIPSEGNNGSIYVKVLEEGTETESVYYNSTVKVYYSGRLIDGTVFDSAEEPYKAAATFTVSSLIAGWTIALQHMKVGDRWEIWIPYMLAYGTAGTSNGTIPPYSTLVFEVKLVGIIEQ